MYAGLEKGSTTKVGYKESGSLIISGRITRHTNIGQNETVTPSGRLAQICLHFWTVDPLLQEPQPASEGLGLY